jgi:hypothetical protein
MFEEEWRRWRHWREGGFAKPFRHVARSAKRTRFRTFGRRMAIRGRKHPVAAATGPPPQARIVPVIGAIDLTEALVSSAVIAAVVGGLTSFLTQRYLLNRKAQIDYDFMARKRLYEALGPLRMQLLLAARDVVRRVKGHAGTRWQMDPSDHYARSFIYRLLRPLAVAQLIERQMGVADFSVDKGAVALLLFNTAAERMLSGDDIVLDHPLVDWSTQSQHLIRDNLRAAAATLISDGDRGPEVLDYARFQRAFPNPEEDPALRDMALIFRRCRAALTENSLLWLRVVGYGYACNRLIATQGTSIGFEDRPFPAAEMLSAVDDEYITSRVTAYIREFDTIISQGL